MVKCVTVKRIAVSGNLVTIIFKEESGANFMESRFIMCLNMAINKINDYEELGDRTDFYDEDGVVVMSASEPEPGKILFEFPDGESFNVEHI